MKSVNVTFGLFAGVLFAGLVATASSFAQTTTEPTKQPTQSMAHADATKQQTQSMAHADATKQQTQSMAHADATKQQTQSMAHSDLSVADGLTKQH